MTTFKKGDKVFRYYSCEPAFIYGTGKQKEQGEVIGEPIEWDEKLWVPVKWQYSQVPDLYMAANVYFADQS